MDTDYSGLGIGAVLSQDQGDGEWPIAYYSRKLNKAERKYGITKQEMCALVAGVRHFKPYLHGAKFLVRVDHHSLIWLTNLKAPSGILARWLETLASFDFQVIHQPGKQHQNADGLSRQYSPDCDYEETPKTTPTAPVNTHTPVLMGVSQ